MTFRSHRERLLRAVVWAAGAAAVGSGCFLLFLNGTGPNPIDPPVKVSKVPPPAPLQHDPETASRIAASRGPDLTKKAAPTGKEFRGADYRAWVSERGLRFEGQGVSLSLESSVVEQGRTRIGLGPGMGVGSGSKVASIHHGRIIEEYVFEERRVEQIYRIPHPIGEGALRIRMKASSNLAGPVRSIQGWVTQDRAGGGLSFCDEAGQEKLAYYGATAFDARGRKTAVRAGYRDGTIVLEVPGSFMASAAYPLVVDPWIELAGSGSGGGVSNNALSSRSHALAVDPSGNPVIAWSQDVGAGVREIYVLRWDGAAWTELAGSGSGGGISNDGGPSNETSLALDLSGNPVVAWRGGNSKIYVRQWNGAAWIELAGSATGNGISGATTGAIKPSVAVDPSGNPVVAWEDFGGGSSQIFLKRWNGAAWVELAGSATGGGISGTVGFNPSLAMDGSDPVVAWETLGSEIHLRRWTGAVWAEVGGSATGGGISNTAFAQIPSLAIDGSGNPVVAWGEGSGFVFLRRWNGASWIELDGSGSGNGIGSGGDVSLVLDGAGNPFVAWHVSVGGWFEIYLRRWNGGAWEWLGGSAAGGGISNTVSTSSTLPSLGIDGSGNPVVAWEQDVGGANFEIYLRQWSPDPWAELGESAAGGGVSNTAVSSMFPSVAFDPSGNPAIAWEETDQGQIYFRRWNGLFWEELAGSATGTGISNAGGGGVAFRPSLSVDASGDPVVAWYVDTFGVRDVYLRRWNGASWVEVGGSGSGPGISNTGAALEPSLALDSADNPVVAWRSDTDVYLRRWNGAIWEEVAGSGSGGGISNDGVTVIEPSLSLDGSDNPVVAWGSFNTPWQIYLRRWNGISWIELGGSATAGGISGNVGDSENPSLAVDSSGNPVVAWDDNSSGTHQIYVRRWNGAAWVELAGSGTGGGVSNTGMNSVLPSLVLDSTDAPLVAWQEDAGSVFQIYLRGWDGASWVEMDGSATGGGISNTAATDVAPSLAIDGSGNLAVAWHNFTTGPEIYFRRHTAVGGPDVTPPAAGTVNDGAGADIDFQISTTTIEANWTGFSDPESGITLYEWGIGTTSGATDIQAFTGVGLSTSATSAALPLSAGSIYYVTVRATNGVALTSTATSDGVTVDTTAPVAGTVNDGAGADIDTQASTNTISANWSGFADPESGITLYEWGIGTTSGATDIQAFTGVGLSTSAANSGLSLSIGPTYYVSVRATNGVAMTVTATSDGVQVTSGNTAPGIPSGLAQFRSDGVTSVAVGATHDEATLIVDGTVSDPDGGQTVAIEVEIQPVGTPFTDTPTVTGTFVAAAGGTSRATITGLTDGSYHWQARAIDSVGGTSAFVSFGANPEASADVQILLPFLAPSGSGFTPVGSVFTTVSGNSLDWSDATHATGILDYQIQVATDPTFAAPVVDTSSVTSQFALPVLPEGLYYWRVRARNGVGTFSPWTPWSTYGIAATAATPLPSPPVTGGLSPSAYTMVSLPFVPPTADPFAPFTAALGPYDITLWRLVRWDPATGTFGEFPNVPPPIPGRAYWLIALQTYTLDRQGTSTATLPEWVVELEPGWNQVGNPYTQPAPWSSVTVTDQTVVLAADSPTNNLCGQVVFEFDGSGYVVSPTLDPWNGYWLFNKTTSPVYITIPRPAGSTAPTVPATLPSGEPVPPAPPGSGPASPDGGGCGATGIEVVWILLLGLARPRRRR